MNDKYVFETESSREMEILASRHKILSVLDDIKKNYIKDMIIM